MTVRLRTLGTADRELAAAFLAESPTENLFLAAKVASFGLDRRRLGRVHAFERDGRVGALLLDLDSPGGEVSGCFAFARKLSTMGARNGGKPIIAFANEMACSAAYAIASACDAVMTTPTGQVGSIGVWTMMVDMTKGLSKNGIEVTMIRAGERKARGGPYEHADKATVDKLQGWVDETWGMFADHVAANRPISRQAVMALEGDWFTGNDALGLGLVDAVDTPEAIFEAVAKLAR